MHVAMLNPHIRPTGIIFCRVLLEITKFHLHKSLPAAGIIRNAGVNRGRALYEEIQYICCGLYWRAYNSSEKQTAGAKSLLSYCIYCAW